MAGVRETFTADDARHWALLTRAAFAVRRREIDALNVFPVPDGDTGTNLYLTLDGALDHVVDGHTRLGILGKATLQQECEHLGRAILLSARGNSGVILSQMVRGLTQVVVEGDLETLDAAQMATALARGATLARKAVAHPQEGTMLSVADAAALAALAAREGTLAEVVDAARVAAIAALDRTPEQLPVLADAGVVDAGGAGCVLILEALTRVVTGAWTEQDEAVLGGGGGLARRDEWHRDPQSGASPFRPTEATAEPVSIGGPAYEVMYVLEDSDDEKVATLTATLDGLGDSLIVSGGPDLWTVHVHVDDVGAAIEAGIEAGRPRRIAVTSFADQIARHRERQALGVVACAAGPGIAAIMREAGAIVVTSAPGARASAGQLLEAARRTGAHAVLILPNDMDTVLAAEAAVDAAAHEGISAHVIPSRTAVQGLAALAVHDPSHPVQDNVVAMTGAARATRHGAVTVAVKEGLTSGGHCVPGDVLGIVDGDIVIVEQVPAAADGGPGERGAVLADVATEVVRRLMGAGGELVTLLTGLEVDEGLVDEVERAVKEAGPHLEVLRLVGGQAAYPLLIGVE